MLSFEGALEKEGVSLPVEEGPARQRSWGAQGSAGRGAWHRAAAARGRGLREGNLGEGELRKDFGGSEEVCREAPKGSWGTQGSGGSSEG